MIGGIQNITKIPELKKKIWFTLAMLAVYRVGVHIPSPGIDTVALAAFFKRAQGTLFGLFDMFSGGAFEHMSVFALGIMPYISSSIILDLLTVVIPYLDKLKKEGEAGRKKITQYARYGTVVLSLFQGFGIAVGMENMAGPGGASVVIHAGWAFRLMTMITLTSGTAFIMWLGEQITERGIGNGISLIIFAGIVARMPSAVSSIFQLVRTGEMNFVFSLLLLVVMAGVVGFIVFVERGQRRIPVQYAKRVVGPEDLWRAEHPSASEDQYFGGHTAHFCLFHSYVSGDDHPVRPDPVAECFCQELYERGRPALFSDLCGI